MADRKRVTLWFSEGEMRDIDAAAERAGVETGAACRLAVIRAIHGVCRDASDGRVRLRARSAPAPVLGRAHVEPPLASPAAAPPSSPVARTAAEAREVYDAALEHIETAVREIEQSNRAEIARLLSRPR